jgi:hypothetical protein
MRLNDIGLLAIVLMAGLLVGIVGTLGVYNAVAAHQADAEKAEAEETIRRLQDERDQLQAQLQDYAEAERNKRLAVEQPGAAEPPAHAGAAPRPEVAAPRPEAAAPRPEAAPPKKREAVAAPREDRSSAKAAPDPAGGFGPPREYGNK